MPNGLKTALLLGLMSALVLAIGEVLGGSNGLIMAFGFAALMNFGSYWFSDKIVLRMYRAQAVGPEHALYRMVERLAARANLPMPKVYIIPDPSPNAFATGRNPSHAAVAATEGILKVLSEHELEGVIAHELAHVKNRDILTSSVAATLAAAIMMLARMAMFFGGSRDDNGRGANPIVLLAMMIRRAAGGDADPDGDLALARVRGGCRRCGDRRESRMDSRTRCARSTRSRSVSRSTPIRRPRTCSS